MNDESSGKTGPGFSDFLLAEYENIAGAHFRAIQTITSFFRYYLLIMSVPVSAIAFLLNWGGHEAPGQLVWRFQFPAYLGLFAVSVVGLFVYLYILNLRFDAVLYARVINGVRKYYYDRSGAPAWEQARLRVLPQTTAVPHYVEPRYFLPVVLVFGLVNSSYLAGAMYVLNSLRFDFSVWSQFLSMLGLHVATYYWYAEHRDRAYLKSNIIGVDIDGVLNNHRTTFCELLRRLTGKNVEPDRITHIPLHENKALDVDLKHERCVFNHPLYWTMQTPAEGAQRVLSRARNVLKMRVFLFTHRPWPDAQPRGRLAALKRTFHKACSSPPIWETLACWLAPTSANPVARITKDWLKRHGFEFDKLVVEKGNDYSTDPIGHANNRFHYASHTNMRYFVEDDVVKAAKLAYICDFVFLLEHPYNKPNEDMPTYVREVADSLPTNVLPVKDWNEVWQHLRRLA